MLLKFFHYLRSKIPRDEVLGPWIDEIQAQTDTDEDEEVQSNGADRDARSNADE